MEGEASKTINNQNIKPKRLDYVKRQWIRSMVLAAAITASPVVGILPGSGKEASVQTGNVASVSSMETNRDVPAEFESLANNPQVAFEKPADKEYFLSLARKLAPSETAKFLAKHASKYLSDSKHILVIRNGGKRGQFNLGADNKFYLDLQGMDKESITGGTLYAHVIAAHELGYLWQFSQIGVAALDQKEPPKDRSMISFYDTSTNPSKKEKTERYRFYSLPEENGVFWENKVRAELGLPLRQAY